MHKKWLDLIRSWKVRGVVFPWPHSLRWRLMISLAAIFVFIMILSGIAVAVSVYRVETVAWRGRQSEAARNAADTVAAFIQRAEDVMLMVALLGSDELRADPQFMPNMLVQHPALLELVYLDGDGTVLATASRDRPVLSALFTIPQSQWFTAAKGGQHYHSTVYFSSAAEPYMIVALPAPGGKVIAGRILMRVLWDVVREVRFGERGRVYIVNGDGQIIAHADPAVVMAHTNVRHHPGLEAVFQGPARGWQGAHLDLQGTPVVAATAPVADMDWTVVAELPEAEAFAVSREILPRVVSAVILLAVVVMWGSARLLDRLVFRPIEALQDGAERIGEGHLEHRIRFGGRDEVSRVAQAFDQMAERLCDQHGLLTQRNMELEGLYRLGLELASRLDLDAVLDTILELVFTFFPGVVDVHIFLYDSGLQKLQFVASRWADGRRNILAAEPRPAGLTYTVARQGEPMIVSDMQVHPLFAHLNRSGTLVGIPLKVGGRVVGVMNVAHPQPCAFSDEEMRLLRMLGDQAAVAIENARLYKELQRELAERERAEQALRQARDELEQRVWERTAELVEANERLQAEIAERQRVQEALIQAQKMEVLGRLAGGVAHDFNNLLTAIVGYATLVKEQLPPNSPLSNDLQEVLKNSERAASLTRQLLAFSRRQTMTLQAVDVNRLIGDMNKMLRRVIGEDITLEVINSAEAAWVRADPSQLEQVILNLAVNARDAMPQGGQLTIRTGCASLKQSCVYDLPERVSGEYVAISVIDTGVGMTDEIKAHIFEPFFTTKEVGKGTGLGLSTVYGIVKQHGGEITVESAPGAGSTFTVYLPRFTPNGPLPNPNVGLVSMEASPGHETILLVEDEAPLRGFISQVLGRLGYKVLEAARPSQAFALAEAQSGQVNLLLTDVVMPEMSGKALAETLQRQYPGMKVLLMSGYAEDVVIHHGVAMGEVDILQKPFTPEQLVRRVQAVLARRATGSQVTDGGAAAGGTGG